MCAGNGEEPAVYFSPLHGVSLPLGEFRTVPEDS